ncbi:MAG: preQ(1) synthase [Planctomycetota bacterium]
MPHEQSRIRRDEELPRASLGQRRETPVTYTPALLEAVPLASQRGDGQQQCWVSLDCLRFTSLCPVTGQPDWATITVNYVPRRLLVESKSLKEYLNSFRMHGDFHEDVCRVICEDLVRCTEPRYLEVVGDFDSRGSIAIRPYVQWALEGDAGAQEIRRERFLHYRPGRYSGSRS